MHRFVISHLSLVIAMLFLAACETTPQPKPNQRVAIDQVPPAVLDSFQRTFPGIQISHIDYFPNYHDRGPAFEVKFYDAIGAYHRKGFTPNGQLLDNPADVALAAPSPGQPYPNQPTYSPPPPQPYAPPYPQPAPPPRY